MSASITVRVERAEDAAAIRGINLAAFGGPIEADLVETLRADGAVLLSLVAEVARQTVGHILFSRMWIDGDHGSTSAVALAPVAVLPEFQKRGVGTALVNRGIELVRAAGERITFVLGEPQYYQRFGFSTANTASIRTPFPPANFMALELVPGALAGVAGAVRYPAAFGL
jgi:putative acetyltransferase